MNFTQFKWARSWTQHILTSSMSFSLHRFTLLKSFLCFRLVYKLTLFLHTVQQWHRQPKDVPRQGQNRACASTQACVSECVDKDKTLIPRCCDAPPMPRCRPHACWCPSRAAMTPLSRCSHAAVTPLPRCVAAAQRQQWHSSSAVLTPLSRSNDAPLTPLPSSGDAPDAPPTLRWRHFHAPPTQRSGCDDAAPLLCWRAVAPLTQQWHPSHAAMTPLSRRSHAAMTPAAKGGGTDGPGQGMALRVGQGGGGVAGSVGVEWGARWWYWLEKTAKQSREKKCSGQTYSVFLSFPATSCLSRQSTIKTPYNCPQPWDLVYNVTLHGSCQNPKQWTLNTNWLHY